MVAQRVDAAARKTHVACQEPRVLGERLGQFGQRLLPFLLQFSVLLEELFVEFQLGHFAVFGIQTGPIGSQKGHRVFDEDLVHGLDSLHVIGQLASRV